MPILLDASSPARVNTSTNAGQTLDTGISPSFNPPANTWLFLYITGNQSATSSATFNTPTQTGNVLSWALVDSSIHPSGGSCAVWRAFNASAQTGIVVTATISYSVASGAAGSGNSGSLWIQARTGCAASQTGAATNKATSATQTNNPFLKTTRYGSQVAALLLDWSAGGNPTSADTISPYTVATQTSGALAYKAAVSAKPDTVSINIVTGGGSPQNSYMIHEIFSADTPSTAAADIDETYFPIPNIAADYVQRNPQP